VRHVVVDEPEPAVQARAIAMRDSVTVSMSAETTGRCSESPGAARLEIRVPRENFGIQRGERDVVVGEGEPASEKKNSSADDKTTGPIPRQMRCGGFHEQHACGADENQAGIFPTARAELRVLCCLREDRDRISCAMSDKPEIELVRR